MIRRYSDLDDIYMEYDDLVEAGEIDPAVTSVEDYIESKVSGLTDYDLYSGD
jgi:hypothetical protein